MNRHVLAATCGLMLLASAGPARAQAPVPGQPYQVPADYAGYPAGTAIAYGGYNYVIQANSTMLLADQPAGTVDEGADAGADDPGDQGSVQAYQIPAGYAVYPAGTTITYGGGSYVIQPNGTMIPAVGPSSASVGDDPGAGQVYVVPEGYVTYPAGTQITLGGLSYVIGLNRTMVLVTKGHNSSIHGGPWSGKPNGGGHISHYGPAGPGPHPTTSGTHPGASTNPGAGPHPTGSVTHPGGGGHHPPPGMVTHPNAGGPRPSMNGRPAGTSVRPVPFVHRPAVGGFAQGGPHPGGGLRPPTNGGSRPPTNAARRGR